MQECLAREMPYSVLRDDASGPEALLRNIEYNLLISMPLSVQVGLDEGLRRHLKTPCKNGGGAPSESHYSDV